MARTTFEGHTGDKDKDAIDAPGASQGQKTKEKDNAKQ